MRCADCPDDCFYDFFLGAPFLLLAACTAGRQMQVLIRQAGKAVTQPLRASGHGVAADMATGLLQQTAAGILFTPIDIIKERLQVRRYVQQILSHTAIKCGVSLRLPPSDPAPNV